EIDRALDCHSHHRDRNAARCRTPAQESPWRLRPRHQLVKGVESVTKTPSDVHAKRSLERRRFISARPELVGSRRAVLSALLLCSSALGGCATYTPPEISYDAEVPPLPATPVALDDRS